MALNSHNRKSGGGGPSQEYDDDGGAADIEDADRGDDEDEEHSGSQVRKHPSKNNNKMGIYKEDYGTSAVSGAGGAGALNGADLKKKFHF